MTQQQGSFQELVTLGLAAAKFENKPVPSLHEIEVCIKIEERMISSKQEASRKRSSRGTGRSIDSIGAVLSSEGKQILKIFKNEMKTSEYQRAARDLQGFEASGMKDRASLESNLNVTLKRTRGRLTKKILDQVDKVYGLAVSQTQDTIKKEGGPTQTFFSTLKGAVTTAMYQAVLDLLLEVRQFYRSGKYDNAIEKLNLCKGLLDQSGPAAHRLKLFLDYSFPLYEPATKNIMLVPKDSATSVLPRGLKRGATAVEPVGGLPYKLQANLPVSKDLNVNENGVDVAGQRILSSVEFNLNTVVNGNSSKATADSDTALATTSAASYQSRLQTPQTQQQPPVSTMPYQDYVNAVSMGPNMLGANAPLWEMQQFDQRRLMLMQHPMMQGSQMYHHMPLRTNQQIYHQPGAQRNMLQSRQMASNLYGRSRYDIPQAVPSLPSTWRQRPQENQAVPITSHSTPSMAFESTFFVPQFSGALNSAKPLPSVPPMHQYSPANLSLPNHSIPDADDIPADDIIEEQHPNVTPVADKTYANTMIDSTLG